jgi:hypothetical protein
MRNGGLQSQLMWESNLPQLHQIVQKLADNLDWLGLTNTGLKETAFVGIATVLGSLGEVQTTHWQSSAERKPVPKTFELQVTHDFL